MPWQDFLPIVPVVGDIAGKMIDRAQSRKDIERQNAYNTPAAQLARLRKAGLPMGAMGGNIANTQSALPQTSGSGIAEGGRGIANFITNQTQLQQLEILKEEVRLKRSERKKNEAETTYLLEGAGEDRQGTNLTRNLRTQYGIQAAQEKGAELTNKITEVTAENARTKAALENTEAIQRIGKLIQDRELTSKQIEGAGYENQIKSVIAQYQKGMSDAQLAKLLKENGLLDKSITGKGIENDIQSIRYEIEKATKEANIMKTDAEAAQAMVSYESTKEYFKNYQEYQQWVDLVQDELRKPLNQRSVKGTLKMIQAWAYTTITGITGASPNGTSFLNFLKQ